MNDLDPSPDEYLLSIDPLALLRSRRIFLAAAEATNTQLSDSAMHLALFGTLRLFELQASAYLSGHEALVRAVDLAVAENRPPRIYLRSSAFYAQLSSDLSLSLVSAWRHYSRSVAAHNPHTLWRNVSLHSAAAHHLSRYLSEAWLSAALGPAPHAPRGGLCLPCAENIAAIQACVSRLNPALGGDDYFSIAAAEAQAAGRATLSRLRGEETN